jgi:hypothetical protein
MAWHATSTRHLEEKWPRLQVSLPTRRHIVVACIVLGIGLQFADMGLDVRKIIASDLASATGWIGVGDFVSGCIAALFFRR